MTDEAPQTEGQAAAPEAQGQATEWYGSAPDEVKGYIQNKGWDDPLKAVNAYQNLEKFHGVPADQLLKLPKDFNEEGALDPIYTRLGRPDSPDKYEIELPEDIQVDENRLKAAKEIGHKIGLNNKQIQALAEFDASYMTQAMTAQQEQVAAQQEREYEDWKREQGQHYMEREELARRFIRNSVPQGMDKDETLAKIEEAIGTAATMKLFSNAGEKFKEDKIHDSGGDRPFGYTAEQAKYDKKTLMSEIQGDKTRLDNYNKGIGPDLEKMKKLNQIIAG